MLRRSLLQILLDYTFKICPQELVPNIWEWLEDKETYTEIKCCGLSLNDLFNHGCDKKLFFKAMCVLNDLKLRFNGEWNWYLVFLYYKTCGIGY